MTSLLQTGCWSVRRLACACLVHFLLVSMLTLVRGTLANHDAKRLYDKLLRQSGYNKIIRPVKNESEKISVKVALKLTQLIDLDEINQVMTTNVWLSQEWYDTSLTWDPKAYGDVDFIYVPADTIWHPDIVLYNTADGNYQVTQGTKATLRHDGLIHWNPPASFKSSCDIDITYFPFDQQTCGLSFGSWTYNKYEVDLVHAVQTKLGMSENSTLALGIDLRDFYVNVEWDLMSAPAKKGYFYYAGSEEQFPEWTFNMTLKRKFLFYTVNLIIPLVSHSFVTVLVFYLPASSKEKISLCINILLSLIVFFLMLAEIIPPSSLVMPLLGKYLVFTLVLVAISVVITTMTYNVHFRSASTHTMPNWVRKIFLYWLPRILRMRRPKIENSHDVELKYIKLNLCPCFGSGGGHDYKSCNNDGPSHRYQFGSKRTRTQNELINLSSELDENSLGIRHSDMQPEVMRAIEGAIFIANHLKQEDDFNRTREDWKYVALVIDRLCLWVFCSVCFACTTMIICWAPMLYDNRERLQLPNSSQD